MSGNHFEKILVFENVHKFWLLRNQQNYFAFWQKLVNRAAKTVLYGSEQLFEGKYFFNEMQFSRFFSDNERRQFKLLTENFQYGPHNRILCLQRKTLIYNLFPGKIFHFLLFSNLGNKQKLFGLLTVFFSRFPKKHFTCGGIFSREKFFLKKFFYSCFLDTELRSVGSWRRFFCRALKTFFSCQEEHIQEVFWKNCVFFVLVGYWTKTLRSFLEVFLKEISKLQFHKLSDIKQKISWNFSAIFIKVMSKLYSTCLKR